MTTASSALTHWLSPTAMQSLAWALLHFLWQGTALAALAAAAMALCRRASARYLVAVTALALMLLTPFATFLYSQRSGVADAAMSSPFAAPAWSTARGNAAASDPMANDSMASRSISPSSTDRRPIAPSRSPAYNALPWLVEAWLLGVTFFSLRSAGGFFLLERERRKRSSVVGERVLQICHTLQNQLGLRRAIAYCECKWLQAPAVIGWFRPVVFLPVTALSGLSEDQLQAVIAHELAHIQRLDPFVNVFQVCVETLLFYHPAVWWLNKRIRAEREHCCDDVAVALCGNAVEYARALTLMEEWRSAPVFVMAANRGPLTERIVRVLGLKTLGAGMRGVGLTGSLLCLTAALAAGNALLGMAHPTPAQQAAASTTQTPPTAPTKSTNSSKPSPAQPSPTQPSPAQPSPTRAQSPAAASSPAPASTSSYIDAMKVAGFTDLTVDQLIALKIQDVTPEYIDGLRAQGLQPDVEHLIAMRVQGITPDYVREVRASGLSADQNQLIGLKVQGADGAYYSAMKEAGLQPDVNQLIGLKVQGVTPEYVRELRAAGLTLTADKVIGMKVQDVTPQYVKELHDLGLQPKADEIIGMRVQDVTPEYVRGIQALGLQPNVGELIGMRVQGVTPEYIKALQSAGFNVSIPEIIGAKVQDVTPEFIERAKQHGFKNLTLQKLIQLRQLGILDSKADL